MADRTDNRSLGDLLSELSRETGQLVRKEIELATTEMTAKARKAGAQIGIAAAGGALVHAGVLVLLAMLVIALTDLGLAAWLAALIVGVIAVGCRIPDGQSRPQSPARDEHGAAANDADVEGGRTMDDTSRRMNNEETTARTDPQTRDLDDDSAERAREIRSEIEQTRENMSETIGAIQEKLRPGNIASAATDRVKNAASRAARNVADSANQTAQEALDSTRRIAGDLAEDGRMNKIAGAMIAIGSAWLLMNRWLDTGRRRTWRSRGRTYGSRPHELYGAQWRRPSEIDDEYEYDASEVDEYRYDVETASDEGVFARGADRVSSMAEDARERAAEGMDRARNAFSELLDSNPLMVGFAAMAVGATIGLALPETERENEWLGDTKESLVERAQDVARNTADQVRKAAGDIAGQVASDVVSGENG